MIERYLIQYFLAVVEHGNFSRAAQRHGVSQPTLSTGIAKLEAATGHVLFERTNRRVELTAAGARFAVHARRIEIEFARAQQTLNAGERRKLIRIGVISTLPSAWIEAATLEAGQVQHEQLEIVEGRMRELVPRIERGRVDLVLGVLGDDHRGGEPLFHEKYMLALPSDHPLADREAVQPEDVADSAMIVRRHCEALPAISRFFTQRGVRPFFAARTVNDDRAVAYVRAGLGITVMPRCYLQPGIAMPALAGFEQRRSIGFLVDPASVRRVAGSESVSRFETVLRRLAAATAPR
ncbi:LysR family transcriptional regulator [Novosphingobium sp. P6W]|uniref:LysR family transcriptional regulator n=1 Tax=Novosphingobium sp. P6W TaxID=1609758 RepID=UPI0005C2C735|nr:LysR family transcriptional regulator [Novosphingobium sp. P6W]AXB78854.1 LysR family transcriptional regulator [Novosphingobium sp. P6W]KIS30156.1 LysR family transcriptional regulator [Novosphingobium sp. P6W]